MTQEQINAAAAQVITYPQQTADGNEPREYTLGTAVGSSSAASGEGGQLVAGIRATAALLFSSLVPTLPSPSLRS